MVFINKFYLFLIFFTFLFYFCLYFVLIVFTIFYFEEFPCPYKTFQISVSERGFIEKLALSLLTASAYGSDSMVHLGFIMVVTHYVLVRFVNYETSGLKACDKTRTRVVHIFSTSPHRKSISWVSTGHILQNCTM